MHTLKFKRGFTLIELLVVIAIIGILASVVLASLNSARSKGADAAIKSNINNARAQAELYYSDHNNEYQGTGHSLCTTPGGVSALHDAAASAAGGVGYAACTASGQTWALKARLVSTPGQYYCVDSTGKATTATETYVDSFSVNACP